MVYFLFRLNVFFFSHLAVTVGGMWRSRLRATFLSNRDEVNAGDEPAITFKTGYDIYRLLCARALFSSVSPCAGKTYSLASFGFWVGMCDLPMCMAFELAFQYSNLYLKIQFLP